MPFPPKGNLVVVLTAAYQCLGQEGWKTRSPLTAPREGWQPAAMPPPPPAPKEEPVANHPRYEKAGVHCYAGNRHDGAAGDALCAASYPPLYLQIKDLNRGTFGFVQLCKDKQTGERVAIKFIQRGERVRGMWAWALNRESRPNCTPQQWRVCPSSPESTHDFVTRMTALFHTHDCRLPSTSSARW